MLDKKRYALQGFYDGKNCAQAVIMTYANEFNMDTEQALKIASGFGGGMGKLQHTCGAATGAYMIIGMRNSYVFDNELESKNMTTSMIQAFQKRFIRLNGSDQCATLLTVNTNTPEGQEAFKREDMKKEICSKCITSALDILEELFTDGKN